MSNARPETGPMSFGSDWTGIFLRGDCAYSYAQALRALLDPTAQSFEKEIGRLNLQALLRVLDASDERTAKPEDCQKLRAFPDCLPVPEE